MTNHFLTGLGFFLLLGSLVAEAPGQVPQDPDRIRETTREILSRPEFRMFPRLGSGEPASGVSVLPGGKGVPRMKSSRGVPEPGAGQGQNGAGNGRLENAPAGDREGGKGGGNPEDALGRENEFPEADKVDRLLKNQNLAPDAEPGGKDEEGNREDAEANHDPPNRENHRVNRFPNENIPPVRDPGRPLARPRNENRAAERPREAGRVRWRSNNKEALPAPRPRERSRDERNSQFAFREPATGAFAQFVGAMFHFLAWGILAMICGLILWLIVKAIREYERPYAFALGGGDGSSLFDLEPEQAPGDLPADIYLAQARTLADQGRFREAVVQLVFGAMSRAERAGWVRFRRGLTVRDYLRGIQNHPAAYQGFRTMVRVFEPVTFGRREPRQEHYDQSLKGYEMGFGSD